MKKVVRLTFPYGEVTKVKVCADGTLELVLEGVREFEVEEPLVTEIDILEMEDALKPAFLVKVEASGLSITDEFMQYECESREEKRLKSLLEEVINKGIPDFYRPKFDPSLTDKDKIRFAIGRKPAVGKSYFWWGLASKMVCYERNSRLGTKAQYIAFLGVLIKKLVKNGMTVSKAWKAVCCDSIELGYYYNSNGSYGMSTTGTHEVCGFCDLANTRKILASDSEYGPFWKAGGYFASNSRKFTLADFEEHVGISEIQDNAVGWIVFD